MSVAATSTKARKARKAREQRRSARRDTILEAALKVFARKGFDGATIADIAGEAGVATGTLYLYYPSKTDLFAELNGRFFDMINGAVRAADAPPDAEGGTRARVRAVFDACGRHRDLLRLVFINPDPRTEVARRMKHHDEERVRPLVELLTSGMETGAVRRRDPALLARIVNGLVIIALYQCFIQSDGRDARTYEDTVTDMIVGALAPK